MQPRPVIALTADVRAESRKLHFVFAPYVERIEEAGGLAVLIPPQDPARVTQVLELADAFVIVGGEDLDPALYGEEPTPTHEPLPPERERFDLALARALLGSAHPVLGVCYGCQLLTVAAGGALHQHLPAAVGESVRHGGGRYPDLPHHPVDVAPGSRLRAIVGADRIEVNSAHHQAPKRLAGGLVASASAPDGVIEAVEAPGDRFLLAVEWHPELMPDREDQRALFSALVEAAARRPAGRR